jgi:hypothetical protein
MKNKIVPLIILVTCCCFQLTAQTIDRSFYTTDGPVYATAQKGDTVFVGGSFSHMGYGTQKIARYLPDSAKPDLSFLQLPSNATLNAVEPDGNGGYYLCGLFSGYNKVVFNQPANVIHILSDNTLDHDFEYTYLNSAYSNAALCLKKVGNRLYLGGNFNSVNNVTHVNIAALNATTGRPVSWYPDEPDGTVTKIEATDSLVFLLGDFQHIGNYPVSGFATLKALKGKYTRYYSNNLPYNYENITNLKIQNNKLYMGGNFSSLGYKAGGLARVSASTGTADINFPETNGSLKAIIPDGKGGYYIGGDFSLVNNVARTYLAHILADGSVDDAFKFYLDGYVSCLETDGINLYFGGAFTRVNNTTRRYAAAVSLTTNKITDWNPYPDAIVNTMAYDQGIIYMGGNFQNVKNKVRNYAAAVTVSNELTNWNPQPDSYVQKILVSKPGASVFIAGNFSNVGGEYHPGVAKVNNSDGAVSAWDPQAFGTVNDMVLHGSKLFIGGDFVIEQSIFVQFLAGIDTASGKLSNFDPGLNGPVAALAIQNKKLYVAGSFTYLQNQPRNYCGRIDLGSDSIDNWTPAPNDNVSALVAGTDNIVIGGSFQAINEVNRNSIASINLSTNQITAFNPVVNGLYVNSINAFAFLGRELFAGGTFYYSDSSYVSSYSSIISLDTSTGTVTRYFDYLPDYNYGAQINALTIGADQLFAGGNFVILTNPKTAGTITRYNMVSYDLKSNKLSNKEYNPNNNVFALYTDNSQKIIAVGAFSLTHFVTRGNLAALNLITGKPFDWNPAINGYVSALAIKDTLLFVGGSFNSIGVFPKDKPRQDLAAISTKTGRVTEWKADLSANFNPVNTLALEDSTLYVGGNFYAIKGISRNSAAAVGTGGTGTVKEWAPEPDNIVSSILPAGNKIYLAGEFTQLNGVPRNFLAAVNHITGKPTAWNPNPDYFVNVLTADSSTLYAGGEFSTISGKPHQSIAAYKIATNALLPFNPKLKNNSFFAVELLGVAAYGNTIFMGSDGTFALDSINGVSRYLLGAADTTTGKATSFDPVPNGAINHLNIIGNKLFVGGEYTSFAISSSSTYFNVFNLQPSQMPGSDIVSKKQSAPVLSDVSIDANPSNDLKAVLFPNPVTDRATLSISGNANNVSITVTDITGKALWQSLNQNARQIQIPVQSFAQGMYFITVRQGMQTLAIKFLKSSK